jgi:hypothetical protein
MHVNIQTISKKIKLKKHTHVMILVNNIYERILDM